MNTARILITATIAAAGFASMGVYAFPAAGEISAVADASDASTLTRTEVAAQAKQAVAHFQDFYLAPVTQSTELSSAEVRSEGRLAVRTHQIAAGDRS